MPAFDFHRGKWDTTALRMTYTPMCRDYTEIRQEDDAIANSFNEKIDTYDYIGLAMTEPTAGDCTIRAHCSFETYGAPLIVLADSVHCDAAGRRMYGAFYEIVSYHAGCNVWRIVPDSSLADKPYRVTNLTRQYFPVPEGSVVELTVRVCGKSAEISVNDNVFTVDLPDLPPSYFVGITTCEGLNRFYDLSVEADRNEKGDIR